MKRTSTLCTVAFFMLAVAIPLVTDSQSVAQGTSDPPLFTATPTILIRSPDPHALAEFYLALGLKEGRRTPTGVFIYLENNHASIEILKMDPNTPISGPKTSRTQQGVVPIFEATDQVDVVRRAELAGSPLIERLNSSARGHSLYYIADWENNIIGFAPRYHNPDMNVPGWRGSE